MKFHLVPDDFGDPYSIALEAECEGDLAILNHWLMWRDEGAGIETMLLPSGLAFLWRRKPSFQPVLH